MKDIRSGLKRENIRINPREVVFIDHGIQFVMEDGRKETLDEDRILLVCVEQDDAVGRGKRLPVEQVTFETGGYVILGTIYGTRCEVVLPRTYMSAGKFLILTVEQFPWLWAGDHRCLDGGKESDWKELRQMVEIMRAGSILPCGI